MKYYVWHLVGEVMCKFELPKPSEINMILEVSCTMHYTFCQCVVPQDRIFVFVIISIETAPQLPSVPLRMHKQTMPKVLSPFCCLLSAPTKHQKAPSVKEKLREYLNAFGGESKDFSSIGYQFDEIFDEDFSVIEQDGKTYNREMLRQCHSYFFEHGFQAELLDFNYISSDKAEVKFIVKKDDEVIIVVHSFATIIDGKIIRQKPFDRSFQHHKNGHYLREIRRG